MHMQTNAHASVCREHVGKNEKCKQCGTTTDWQRQAGKESKARQGKKRGGLRCAALRCAPLRCAALRFAGGRVFSTLSTSLLLSSHHCPADRCLGFVAVQGAAKSSINDSVGAYSVSVGRHRAKLPRDVSLQQVPPRIAPPVRVGVGVCREGWVG